MPGSPSPGSMPHGGPLPPMPSAEGSCVLALMVVDISSLPTTCWVLAGGCRWQRALPVAAFCLPACKAAFLKIPSAMSSAGACSGHGGVTARKRTGASLGDQAEIIPASVGDPCGEEGTSRVPAAWGTPAHPAASVHPLGLTALP